MGRISEALEILERLRGRTPEEQCGRQTDFFFACNLLDTLANTYAGAGRFEEAFELVQRGIELNPDFVPFRLSIASHYRGLGDRETALRHVERAIELNPMLGEAHWQKGRLLFGLDKHTEAKAALETALRYEPQRLEIVFSLGVIEAELENWPQSVKRFQRLVDLDPTDAQAHLYLARSLGEGERIDDAWQALRIAQEYGADASAVRATERRLRQLENEG